MKLASSKGKIHRGNAMPCEGQRNEGNPIIVKFITFLEVGEGAGDLSCIGKSRINFLGALFIHWQVKINDENEQCFGVVMVPL